MFSFAPRLLFRGIMKLGIQAKGNRLFAQEVSDQQESKFARVEASGGQKYMRVVSVGKDVENCKAGDKILPFGDQFRAFKLNGEQYIILHDDEVAGVFDV